MEQITVYVPAKNRTALFLATVTENIGGFATLTNTNLEKKQGYLFTPEELEEVIGKAFDAGKLRLYGEEYGKVPTNVPNKEQYINNRIK
jgi:hypothetical protein